MAYEDVSNSLQDVTLDTRKITYTAFNLLDIDVLSHHEKKVLSKTLIKCLRFLYMF